MIAEMALRGRRPRSTATLSPLLRIWASSGPPLNSLPLAPQGNSSLDNKKVCRALENDLHLPASTPRQYDYLFPIHIRSLQLTPARSPHQHPHLGVALRLGVLAATEVQARRTRLVCKCHHERADSL
jgi:hypothetical protein